MRYVPVALLVGAALLLGACGQVDDAVDDAADRADRVVETARYCVQAVEVAQAVADGDVDAAVDAGEELVEVAPSDLEEEARTLLEAAERARDGDQAALQSDEVATAAQRVRETTEQECSPGNG